MDETPRGLYSARDPALIINTEEEDVDPPGFDMVILVVRVDELAASDSFRVGLRLKSVFCFY